MEPKLISNNPKVSIIVPVYKVEKYIKRCVDSVINQDLKDIEIILIDDESPDGCPAICDNYAKSDNRIKVIHKKNGGLGLARNSGLEKATGKYVAFLDSDDYVDKDTYSFLYSICEQEKLDGVYYAYEVIRSDGSIIGHNSSKIIKLYDGNRFTKRLSLEMLGSLPHEKHDRNVQMSSCTAFYKREIIEIHHIRFHSEREIISEDLVFNIDFLAVVEKVVTIPTTFYHYFVNEKSLTHQIADNRVERDIKMYVYLQKKFEDGKYDWNWPLRLKRMLLGYSRGDIFAFMKANIPSTQKKEWLRKEMHKPIWNDVFKDYPIWQMPLKYALFAWAFKNKHYHIIRLLCKLK